VATRAAAASDHQVALAAREALTRGNAVDAVVAGLLSAAAESPGVLLGPLQLLVAGAGAGLIAADGRLRQPGLGTPRPRGARTAESIPPPARVAVPALPATVATALASFGTVTLRRLGAPAVKAAKALSPERASVLDAFCRRGAPFLHDEPVATPLLAVAGRAASGLLTADDLAEVRPEIVRLDERSLRPSGWLRVPWRDTERDASDVQVVAAADGRGLMCVACYVTAGEGVAIPELGLLAPASAEPVMRGQTRVRPGEPRPSAAPIAIRARKGIADLAVGLGCAKDAETALSALFAKLDALPLPSEALSGVSGRSVAVVRTREAALVASSA
jgi:gamma-glutamyltranspeptidase/glutathione hydrolase